MDTDRDDNDAGSTSPQYTLGEGETAKDLYEVLAAKREPVVAMARRMAALTIPSAFPPDGYNPGDDLPGNNQSASAGLVNGLASTLMFTAFPPGQPVFNLKIIETTISDDVERDPELYSQLQLSLSRLEIAHRALMMTTNLTSTYTEFIKQLLIAGNCLWKQLSREEPMFFKCDQYVVKRSAAGHPLLMILEEMTPLRSLEPDLREFIMSKPEAEKLKDASGGDGGHVNEWEREIPIYSVCRLVVEEGGEKTWEYWEEWEGHTLPGTEAAVDYDYPPMWSAWLIPVYGKDWGRSYCEEYRGDLYSLENQWSSLNDGSALAALALLFVKAGATTSVNSVREARNLSILTGDAADLTVFRSDKTADLSWVYNVAQGIENRLDRVFLRQQSIQRSGERVTAEEIRRLSVEIDKALGGLYTTIAQGPQRRIIMRNIALNTEEVESLPELPKEVVRVEIATGIDAMGNSTDFDNLMDYSAAGRAAFPVSFEQVHNPHDFFTRLASAKGIKPTGLVKTPEQTAQEQQAAKQDAMMQTIVDKGAGPAAGQLAAMAKENLAGGGGGSSGSAAGAPTGEEPQVAPETSNQ